MRCLRYDAADVADLVVPTGVWVEEGWVAATPWSLIRHRPSVQTTATGTSVSSPLWAKVTVTTGPVGSDETTRQPVPAGSGGSRWWVTSAPNVGVAHWDVGACFASSSAAPAAPLQARGRIPRGRHHRARIGQGLYPSTREWCPVRFDRRTRGTLRWLAVPTPLRVHRSS